MSDKPKNYDLIIIGAGPAGLSAAIYASRRNLSTLVITKQVGGLMIMTHQVENYPGFNEISGYDLMEKFKDQAKHLNVEFEFGEAQKISKEKNQFEVLLDNGKKFIGNSVLLAFGLSHRQLNVPGERELSGKGVNYCATCDGPLYRNKTVAVVGGGNSALDAALYLAGLAKKVYLINRTDQFRAESEMLKRARELSNVEIYCDTQISQIKGDKKVSGVEIYNSLKPELKEELDVEGVFIEIGYQPRTDWLKSFIDISPSGEIIVDQNGNTSVEGIFAAGDCTNNKYKQIVIAAGDGAKASLEAYKYIVSHSSNEIGDWGKCELTGSDKTVKVRMEKK